MPTPKPKLPTIALIGTGGTIASTASDPTAMTDYAVTEPVSAILDAVPEITGLANVQYCQPFNVDSRCLDNKMVLKLARRVDRILADPSVDAAVITHGTDTLEETAYFLNLTLKSRKAVVMTGAMRPASARSADGPLNLYHAMLVAAAPDAAGRGVMVAMNESVHAARHVCKTHTSNVQAFSSQQHGCLGGIVNGVPRFFNTPASSHTLATDFTVSGLKTLPWVDIIYDHQSAGPHLFEASIAAGAQGIVLAGTGNGSMSPAAEKGMRLAVRKGVACVRSTRVGDGHVSTSATDARQGLISAGSLNPQKARILLMLALSVTRDRERIQGYFDRC